MFLRVLITAGLLLANGSAAAQQLPDQGQSEAAFRRYVAGKPAFRGQVEAFDAWLRAKRVHGVLPTWQILRTASLWGACNGPAFEVPPRKLWSNVAATLRFVRDHVQPAVGPVQAVSGYRNAPLNRCAGGAVGSAHRDYSALDLVPLKPLTKRQIIYQICPIHSGKGPARGVGLGFYAFTRFHVDTRSFRRWGSAGAQGNESPCAVVERGGDPEAPPVPGEELPPASPAEVPLPRPQTSPNSASGLPSTLN